MVFLFRKEEAKGFLRDVLDWSPSNIVDASNLAEENGIHPSLSEMSRALGVGEHCRRGLYFSDSALPSPVALQHLDVSAAVIYEFCLEFLHLRGREMANAVEEEERRARDRERERARAKARNSGAACDRSRSRFR